MTRKKDHSDEALLHALKQRMLKSIADEKTAHHIINNYGGGAAHGASNVGLGGVMGQLGNGGGEGEVDPGMFDYYVDINKEPTHIDEKGRALGFNKKVHRYRTPKGEEPKGPKA